MTKSGLEMEHTMGSSDSIRKHDCILNEGKPDRRTAEIAYG